MDKIKYAFFDLDGTLLNNNHQITNKCLELLDEIKKHNIKIGIITGRPQCMIKKDVNMIKPDLPVCGINGALVLNKNQNFKKPLLQEVLFDSDLNNIARFIFDNKISVIFYSKDQMLVFDPYQDCNHVKKLKKMIEDYPLEYKWDFKNVSSLYDINNIKIFKILVIIEQRSKEQIKNLQNLVNNTNHTYAIKSQDHLLDIIPKKSSKGKALEFLDNQKYITLKNTIVFGDQANDVSMFKLVKNSVAMKNASSDVQKEASFISDFTNDESGAPLYLLKLLR